MSAQRASRALVWVGVLIVVVAVVLLVVSLTGSHTYKPSGPVARATTLAQFSQVNQLTGTLARGKAPDGTPAIHAHYAGGGANGYQRAIFNVDWKSGDTVAYSARFYLPSKLFDDLEGQLALMRWDDFPDHPDGAAHGGVVLFGRDKVARLVREQLGPRGDAVDDAQLGSPFELPRDRWFQLQVVQHLGGGDAHSEAWLDGKRVAESDDRNITDGRAARRIRYGITAIASGAQRLPLDLWFDDAQAQPGPTPNH